MPEDIALFIDFENIRYSMLNIQRREPDPQELIAVARRYGTVMVARAYADWSRQPEPFKGSLTAAMIDRVDCPAKQRDRIRMGTVHVGTPGALGIASEQGTNSFAAGQFQRPWPTTPPGHSGPLPAISPPNIANGWSYQDTPLAGELDESLITPDEPSEEGYNMPDYQQRDPSRQHLAYQHQPSYGQSPPSGPLSQSGSSTGPLGYPTPSPTPTGPLPAVQSTGNTGHMPAVNPSSGGSSTIVQSTVVQSTVDLNMLMDIIETVFDRPTISTFVLMTGDKDFTRISARLKLRLNKTVIVVGIPGTVSRDLISSANQFVPLVPGGSSPLPPALPAFPNNGAYGSGPLQMSPSPTGTTAPMPAISPNVPNGLNASNNAQFQAYGSPTPFTMDVLDPQLLQFLDYIDRNWSWRTVIGVANFIGDPVNPKNRFRGRLTRDSARELLNMCIQQGVLLLQTDATGAEDLRLNRGHSGVDEVLKQFVR